MSAWGEFHRELRALHKIAGAPSSRDVSELLFGAVSHTTVNDLVRARRIPGKVVTRKIIGALGGDWRVFEPLWKAAVQEEPTAPGTAWVEQILDELGVIRDLLERLVADREKRRE